MNIDPAINVKRVYQSPSLVTYGGIKELTQTGPVVGDYADGYLSGDAWAGYTDTAT